MTNKQLQEAKECLSAILERLKLEAPTPERDVAILKSAKAAIAYIDMSEVNDD